MKAKMLAWHLLLTIPATVVAMVHPLAPSKKPTVVVGAGPAGLATAIMLAKRGWRDIQVLDRLQPPPAAADAGAWSDTARFYLIGLNGRGQQALGKIGAWHAIEPFCSTVVGRKDWSPGSGVDDGVERIFTDRPYLTRVIQRDRLVACLLEQAQGEFADQITVRHGVDVSDIRWVRAGADGTETAVLTCSPCGDECSADDGKLEGGRPGGEFELDAGLVIGADGARRTIADVIEADDVKRRWAFPGSRFRVRRYKDTSVRLYKTVPLSLPADWRGDVNYSARTKTINFDALPTPEGNYCGVLLIKPDDRITQQLPSTNAAREYFDELLPQFSPLISDDDLAAVISKPASRLPIFRYAGPRLHHRSSTLLLGDAIHTVKPYFGLGVNSAFEDVAVLADSIDSSPSLGMALKKFSRRRAAEARALVQLSRSFDYGGLRSFFTFILPLILDGIFHGAMPRIFAPNCLAMLQDPTVSFVGIRWRKRLDRALQLTLLAAVPSAMVAAARSAVMHLACTPAVRSAWPLFAAAPMVAIAARALSLRRRVGSDVADVLAAQTESLSERPLDSATQPTQPVTL